MYTSIIVPLDGSEFGERALPVALALARRSDAVVHLVHVRNPVVLGGGVPMYDTQLDHDVRREMHARLTTVAEQVTRETSLRVSVDLLDGPVVPTLERYLTDRRDDLVVMMTHGRGGLSRAWLGSVADSLVRHVPAPILLVRPGTQWPAELVEPLFCHVLVPLDGSAVAGEVLDHAISLATPGDTVYTLLAVVVPLPLIEQPFFSSAATGDRADAKARTDAAQAHLTSMAAELRESGALVDTRVVTHDQPAQAILETAAAEHVDAIALSTHGRGAVSRILLGSVADKVVRGATVPVLLYRPAHARLESDRGERMSGGSAMRPAAALSPAINGTRVSSSR